MGNKNIFTSACPHCRQSISIATSTAGQILSCPFCQQEFTTPLGNSTSGRGCRHRRPKKISPLIYVMVAAISALLIGGLIVLVEKSSASPADESRYVLSDYPSTQYELRRNAEEGDVAAQYELARFHDKGTDQFPTDPKEAALWYLAAAKGGNPTAQLTIGTLFDMGHGVSKDSGKAEHWLIKAAEQDVVDAQKFLAVLYLGKGSLPYDAKRSIKWMTRAAERGDGEAQFHLSVAYQKGEGVDPDTKESERWLQNAVQSGYKPAISVVRSRETQMENQVYRMLQQQAAKLPRSSGFYTPPPSQYVPPQFKEAQRRAEAAMRSQQRNR